MAATAIKERPILFSAPMVRAILDGRKSQTRRVVKLLANNHQDRAGYVRHCEQEGWLQYAAAGYWIPFPKCPYGKPGDRLWVRETWAIWTTMELFGAGPREMTAYRAGRRWILPDNTVEHQAPDTKPERVNWRPSIYMPRKLSRITLEVVDVRVERVQDISEEDALAEGVLSSVHAFAFLWDSINGKKHPWESSPWVWVISFKRVGA